MMGRFRAVLEASDPARNIRRSYCLEAGTDLFGIWLVEVTYGRIGSRGRSLRYLAADEAEARRLVRYSLRRRATASRRIGASYRVRELIDPGQWASIAVE